MEIVSKLTLPFDFPLVFESSFPVPLSRLPDVFVFFPPRRIFSISTEVNFALARIGSAGCWGPVSGVTETVQIASTLPAILAKVDTEIFSLRFVFLVRSLEGEDSMISTFRRA